MQQNLFDLIGGSLKGETTFKCGLFKAAVPLRTTME